MFSLLVTMQAATNRDVWYEILRYFRINLANDGKEDLQFKRRTILSVALTHQNLVDVALDELWRSMTSLEPIVRVLNAVGESIPLLNFDQSLGFWVSARGLIFNLGP